MADTEDKLIASAVEQGRIRHERPGSERYQQTHMGLIFRDGLSFSGFERNKIFIARANGTFADLSDVSGADSEGDCRATLVADFDDDGDADLFVNAIQGEEQMLFRNDVGVATSNGFVKVRLRARQGHPDAIGATVVASAPVGTRREAQVLSCGSGFESQNAPELIFGLGGAPHVRLTVRWPGRAVEEFGNAKPGGRYLLVEGSGTLAEYPARTFRFGRPTPPGLRIQVGDELKSLSLKTLTGESVNLDVAGSQPTLLNFWATTCRSCIQELPELAELHRKRRYRVVAVCLDAPSAVPTIESLWKKLGVPFATHLIDDDSVNKILDVQRVGIPLSLIITTTGKVERIVRGRIRPGEEL